jgi:4'-phosphopantetheinyl transferase
MSWGYLEATAAELPAVDHWLGAAERAHFARLPAAPRRADWLLGRWAAKSALATWLGLEPSPWTWQRLEVLSDGDGRPVANWRSRPLAEALSLSHRSSRAIAAIAAPGCAIGCDLERIEPRSAAFVADYFTATERADVENAPAGDRELVANLVWSAKESVLKLLGVGLSVDTRRVSVRMSAPVADAEWSRFDATDAGGGHRFDGWWRRDRGFVATFCAHPAGGPPRILAAPVDAGGQPA